MDASVYQKMRVKPQTVGRYFYAPKDYIEMTKSQTHIDFLGDHPTFFHLFVTSQEEYDTRILDVLPLLKDHNSRLWISYKKASKNKTYDINRDTFFALSKRDGLTPFSNVALDREWSCLGFKKAQQ